MQESYRLVSRYARAAAALLAAALVAGLLIGGAQPFAVNLIPAPWDKLAHGVVFALLGAALGRATGARGLRMLLPALAGAILIGAVDELHQTLLPGRQAGWDDLAADAIGALAGALALLWRQRATGLAKP
jgi:VanZ family protein